MRNPRTTVAGKTNHIVTAPISFPARNWPYLGPQDEMVLYAHVNHKYDGSKRFQLIKYACK